MSSKSKKSSILSSLKKYYRKAGKNKETKKLEASVSNFIKAVSENDQGAMTDPASAYRIIESLDMNRKKVDFNLQTEACLKAADVLNHNKETIPDDVLLKECRMIAIFLFKNRKRFDNDMLKDRRKKIRETLSSIEKKKSYRKLLKAYYVKEVLPKAYNERANKPVENKVIIVGKYKSPTPTSAPLGKALEEQGKYSVKYLALKYGRLPDIEFYGIALRLVQNMATAYAVVITEAHYILSYLDVREETKVIQLWHGVGMFKKCGYSLIPEEERANVEYPSHKTYTDVTIAGPIQREMFEESMNIKKGSDIIKPIGIARTDVFYDPSYEEEALRKLHEHYPQTMGKKIILYAPTYRAGAKKGRGPDKLDMREMYDALGDQYVLLIKHHGHAKIVPPIPEGLEDHFVFDMKKNKVLEIEELLAIADICITDYSSIGFEYAITERPLIFFAYDIEEYIDERGLYFGYDEITPGPVVKTTEEIIDYIANIEQRFDPAIVRDFKEKYVSACDGHALERTLALFD